MILGNSLLNPSTSHYKNILSLQKNRDRVTPQRPPYYFWGYWDLLDNRVANADVVTRRNPGSDWRTNRVTRRNPGSGSRWLIRKQILSITWKTSLETDCRERRAWRLYMVTEQDFFHSCPRYFFPHLFSSSSSVSLSNFYLAVPMHGCLGKYLFGKCMSSPFPISILNGTCSLRALILFCGDMPAIKARLNSMTSSWGTAHKKLK